MRTHQNQLEGIALERVIGKSVSVSGLQTHLMRRAAVNGLWATDLWRPLGASLPQDTEEAVAALLMASASPFLPAAFERGGECHDHDQTVMIWRKLQLSV